MATFRKRGARWQAIVPRRGVKEAQTFATKAAAAAWAARIEGDLEAVRAGQVPDKTVADALKKYAAEVSPGKRGAIWETRRLAAMREQKMAQQPLSVLGV